MMARLENPSPRPLACRARVGLARSPFARQPGLGRHIVRFGTVRHCGQSALSAAAAGGFAPGVAPCFAAGCAPGCALQEALASIVNDAESQGETSSRFIHTAP